MLLLLLYLVFILIFICIFIWVGQNFVSVINCLKDVNEWELRLNLKNCYGDILDYLCVVIENKVGEFGEICIKYGLILLSKYQFNVY